MTAKIIQNSNECEAVTNFSDKLVSESPEHTALNNEARELAQVIAKLPDVPLPDRQNFTIKAIWYKHLK